MPVITQIVKQKNRQGRFSVFIDEVYSFPFTDLELSMSGLREGQELTLQQVEEYKRQSLTSKAYDRAINYLSFRQRSGKEITTYLERKGYESGEIEMVLQKLISAGLVNDSNFAASWINDRAAIRPRSKRRLQQELRKKGVDTATIETALGEVDQEAEDEAIKHLALKKMTQAKYQDQRKLLAYLTGQGFDYYQVKRVLETLSTSSDE